MEDGGWKLCRRQWAEAHAAGSKGAGQWWRYIQVHMRKRRRADGEQIAGRWRLDDGQMMGADDGCIAWRVAAGGLVVGDCSMHDQVRRTRNHMCGQYFAALE